MCGREQRGTPIPPTTCAICHRTHCLRCYAKFDTCKECWKKLTPEQRRQAKKAWWDLRKKVVGFTTALVAPIIAVVITWAVLQHYHVLTPEGLDALFYGGLFGWGGGVALALIAFLVKAKKEGRIMVTKTAPMSKKDKKILILVLVFMGAMLALIIGVGLWAYFAFFLD